jgi:hypothetical protein
VCLRILSVIGVFLLVVTSVARSQSGQAAPVGAIDEALRCKQEGWAALAPSERPGVAFISEGACVRYAGSDDVLVPYVQRTGSNPNCALAQNWDGAASLARMDYSGCDLHEAYLHGADLYRANLHDVNLAGADLSSAQLSGALLSNAQLAHANLHQTDFSFAILILAEGAAFLETTRFDNTICPDGSLSDNDPRHTCVGHAPRVHRG